MFLEIGRLRGSINNTSAPNLTQWQYLRLPAEERSSLEVVENLCALANDSQSFYRSVSSKQWLRTVASLDGLIIHSNVVARDAYLDPSRCLDPHRCRGFSHVSELEPTNRSCRNCALAQQMLVEAVDHDADHPKTMLQIEDPVHDVQDLAQGLVHKIVWRGGTFVRKRFNCRGIFERELEVATEVSHPNIVHCFGWSWLESDNSESNNFESDNSESDDETWSSDLFMEWLDVDLQRFLSEEGEVGVPFSSHDALDVLLQVAEAMKHLHEKRFVHGDLKPQNIFLSRVELAHTGVQCYLVKVGDFGCAQRVDAPFCADIGTLHYTAPEVFRCRRQKAPPPEQPEKIDVFSFGVVAFQVLTGVVNLYVGYRSSRAIQEAVMRGLRPSSEFRGSHLDDHRLSMLTFVERCWAENPEERPSFSQICDELNRRSKDQQGLRGNIAKRKHLDGVGEGTNFLKLAKSAVNELCMTIMKPGLKPEGSSYHM